MTPTLRASARPVLIGAATGLRSQWGLAALALTSSAPDGSSPVRRFLCGPWVSGAAVAAAAAEFVADKSTLVPSRLSGPGLVPRLALGATTGALVTQRRRPGGAGLVVAAAMGSAAAFGAAAAGVAWRRVGGSVLPGDGLAAALEDVTAAALAWGACTAPPVGVPPRHRRRMLRPPTGPAIVGCAARWGWDLHRHRRARRRHGRGR